jgi:hypothetical protein
MKRLVIGILLAAMVLPTVVLAEEGRRDGNWWRTQSEAGKSYFLAGFFDGLIHWKELLCLGFP